jgi:hypothetical protein
MFISGLQMCTNEITIVGIFFFKNFEYGGAIVTDLIWEFIFLSLFQLDNNTTLVFMQLFADNR